MLDSLGINYESECPVDIYKLDIFLPDWHLAIEVDGPYHRRKHDKTRDTKLHETYGIETLRIKIVNKYWSQKRILETVVEFIELHAETAGERKRLLLHDNQPS